MKIRNLVVVAITIALGTLCAQAQERDGSVTFTDEFKQRITISRFGTVLSFTNSDGKQIVPNHTFRVCPCGEKSRCVESNAPTDGTTATLEVEFPQRGATLKKGQTLIVAATVRLEAMTLKRRLAWLAGSSVVEIVEAVPESSTAVCSFEERAKVPIGKMCPRPPVLGVHLKCPPPEWFLKQIRYPAELQLLTRFGLDLSR